MPPFLVAYAVISVLVLAVHLAGCAGVVRVAALERRRRRAGARESRAKGSDAGRIATRRSPSVEVVVAVRDEARTLPRLLASLALQTDRSCAFLFVDDRSGDATPELLERFRASLPERVRVLRNEEEPVGLTGKQAALDLAFSQARGEVLLFTDGDCEVPRRWAEEMAARFDDSAVGVVLGRIAPEEGGSFCTKFQAFEQPLINQYNFGLAGLGAPSGCFGNNMGVRLEAVRSVGGFRAIGYSVTEDSALLTAASGRGWKVRIALSAESVVRTSSKPDWASFVNQHTRWNAGAIHSPDPRTRLSYLLVVVLYLPLTLALYPLGFLDSRFALISLTSAVSVGSLGLLAGLYPGVDRARYYLRFLPYLAFFLFFYSFVTWRAFLSRPFEWKGSEFRG